MWISGFGPDSGVTSLCAGFSHTCLIKQGQVYCWGFNGQMQAGQVVPIMFGAPTLVAGIPTNVSSVSCGYEHTCVVLDDNRAMCWGNNLMGELGDESLPTTPTAIPQFVHDFIDVVEITAGYYSTCVVRLINSPLSSERQTWCWGNNGNGQLGVGDNNSPKAQAERMNPDFLGGPKVSPVAGLAAFCGINQQDGAARCVGYGSGGQLGYGDIFEKKTLTAVSGLGYGVRQTSMSVANNRACAIRDDGTAYCWGDYSGTCCLGDGFTATESTKIPQQVDRFGPTDFAQIGVGRNTICAVRGAAADQVWCWGVNSFGGLGIGVVDSTTYTSPQQVFFEAA